MSHWRSERFACWMSQLPPEVLDLPISSVCLPGTHDSATYGPVHLGKQLLGAPNGLAVAKRLSYILHSSVNAWSQTQETNTYEQLRHGCRYLDWRIAYCVADGLFYGIHTFAGPPLKELVRDLLDYLAKYEKEVVVLRVQAYYDTDESALFSELLRSLGRFCMNRGMDDCSVLCKRTLRSLMDAGERIVLIQAHGHRTPEELFSDAPASFPHEIGRPGVPPASLVVAEDDLFYDRWIDTSHYNHKSNGMLHHLNNFLGMRATAQAGRDIVANFVASPLMSHQSLRDMARYMNERLAEWVVNLTSEQRAGLGILAVDYESLSDHVQVAIRLNLERVGLKEFTLPLEEPPQVVSV